MKQSNQLSLSHQGEAFAENAFLNKVKGGQIRLIWLIVYRSHKIINSITLVNGGIVYVYLFTLVDSLGPSRQFFSHVGTFSGLNQQ